jgi:putative aminopeptidase FrvX
MSIDAVVFRRPALLTLAALFGLFFTSQSFAQDGPGLSARLRSWLALDAPPGWEHRATESIKGWERDALGNLKLRKGSGSPRRVVACGLDRPAFAVTEITDEGYLRLREVGAVRQHPLWTQFHEGQRLRVLTRNGGVLPAVAIVKSTHLQGGRNPNAAVTTLNDLWVDIGAASKADVQRLGIQMLDPVVREAHGWSYGGDREYVAGQLAGVRVGCAALAAAATGEVSSGETIFLLTTLRSFGHDGLEAALRSLGKVDQVTLIDSGDAPDSVFQRKVEKPPYLPDTTGLTSVTILSVKVRYPGSLVESVDVDDALALRKEIEKAAGVTRTSRIDNSGWTMLDDAPNKSPRADAFAPTATLLKNLADVYSVSGHEHNMRAAVMAALPAWARAQAKTDAEGNLIVEAGPDRNPVMFIAHLDEVGFEVTNIAADGIVSLRTRGGLFPSLWEGQPALLHFDPPANNNERAKAPLHGVFVPRDIATAKQPETLVAWFGMDGAALEKLGVVKGLAVTAFKEATRLGTTRFTARALDDRAGSTALVLAAKRIVPSLLNHKVILAWSVREETGLEGAIAMSKRYGALVKHVYSIDTFVSSDSPAETTRFAYAPLGQGAVIRGLDNSAVAPPAELTRVLKIAEGQNIPLQVGATNGGTDGSDFIRYGVLHVGLSWPGRYSHSPVEVLDLRDLQALERLIHAIAIAP